MANIKSGIKMLLFILISYAATSNAQTTLTLQPNGASGTDATISNFPNESTTNFGSNAEFISESDAINFSPYAKRGLIKFDLSAIPSNATVISAKLSFYAYNLPGVGGHLVLNNNTGYMFRVNQNWNESTVTWSSQPTYLPGDTIFFGISDSSNQNYLNTDVRTQIQNMVTNPATNYGFLFKQKYECTCNGRMVFGSSDNSNAGLRPKLVITYAICSGAPPNATITPTGNSTICFGNNQILSANTGPGLVYQWYKNGTLINGATGSTFSANASGNYTVNVTNSQGCSTLSAPANLTVSLENAKILTSLGNGTQGCANGGLTMNASAGGTGNTYNWLRNNGPVGSTLASYTSAIPGDYKCIITNSNSTCTFVTNTIQSLEQIPVMNVSGSNYFCTNGNFTIGIQSFNIGTSRTYQWQQNGVNISGATSSIYAPTTSGTYRCIIDDAMCVGNSMTPSYDVFAGVPPLFVIESSTGTNPTNLCGGQTVDLWLLDSISKEQYVNGGVQWYKVGGPSLPYNNGIPFLGSVVNSGIYYASITTTCGISTTPYYYVNSTNSGSTPPKIDPSVASSTCFNYNLSYPDHSVNPWTSYQWQKNNVDIPGATSFNYNATTSGSYRCIFGNGCGTITSTATSITVGLPVATITALGTTTFCAGGNVSLKANTGSGLSYQWKKYANTIPGATSSTYIATTAGKYKCIVTHNSGCSKSSNTITVNVNPLPTATITAAGPTTFCAGGSVVLNANSGTGLTYQWKKYANNIAGAVNTSFTASVAGKYKCVVTNSNGCSKASNAITVSIPCRVGEFENSELIKYTVYPNPTFGDIIIKFDNETEGNYEFIKILDLSGKEANCNIKLDKNQILVHNLKSGLYILKIRVGNTISNEKIVVF